MNRIGEGGGWWRASAGRLRRAALEAASVAAPVDCAACGRPDLSVCDGCVDEVAAASRVSLRNERGSPWSGTARGAPELPVWSALEYGGATRALLLGLKERGRVDAAAALAVPLRASAETALRAFACSGAGAPELTVIPSTRAAFRRRGYHPTAFVLDRARLRFARTLHLARQTDDQAALDAAERAWNRADSLRAVSRVSGRVFLIVDDIVTTGATVREARRALELGGATVAGVVAIAVTRRGETASGGLRRAGTDAEPDR